MGTYLAFRDGLEPSLPVPKTDVLPVALSENLQWFYTGAGKWKSKLGFQHSLSSCYPRRLIQLKLFQYLQKEVFRNRT